MCIRDRVIDWLLLLDESEISDSFNIRTFLIIFLIWKVLKLVLLLIDWTEYKLSRSLVDGAVHELLDKVYVFTHKEQVDESEYSIQSEIDETQEFELKL